MMDAATERIRVAVPQITVGGGTLRGMGGARAGDDDEAAEAEDADEGDEAGETRREEADEEDGVGASAMKASMSFPLMVSICHSSKVSC